MTKDLEKTIAELGPGYGEVVDRLLAECSCPFEHHRATSVFERALAKTRKPKFSIPAARYLIAASLVAVLAIAAIFTNRTKDSAAIAGASDTATKPIEPNSYTLAYMGDYGTAEIIRTQKPDGSWENDFTTRQNAAALRIYDSSSVAYKKAVRYLRSKGLTPISDMELKSRIELASLNYRRR